VISSPYRIVGGPELRETARVVGQRLLTAAGKKGPSGAAPLVDG
jgi:hypothetical protein